MVAFEPYQALHETGMLTPFPYVSTYEYLLAFDEPEFEAYFAWLTSLGYSIPNHPFDLWNDLVNEDRIEPSPIHKDHSDTAWMTDAALRFIEGRGEEPWVLMLGLWRPHPPLVAPAPYHALYDPVDMPEAIPRSEKLHPIHDHMLGRVRAEDYLQGHAGLAKNLSQAAIRNARAVYRGLMREIDDHLARLFNALKRKGRWNDTLIIFTSDHGEMLGDHGLFGKESTFDCTFHVPLIIRDPRPEVPRGRQEKRFTEHVDLLPTILTALGHPIPRQCDGRDLSALFCGGTVDDWRQNAFFEVDFRDLRGGAHRSLGIDDDGVSAAILRGEHWKYVHMPNFPPQFFDLESDREERVNLAGHPRYQAPLHDAMAQMLDWRIAQADRSLTAVSSSAEGLLGWPPNRPDTT